MDSLKKLNSLYERFKNDFEGSFHNVLWQIMINENRKGDEGNCAFTPAIKNGETLLGIADRGMSGYCSTGAGFKTHNHNKAQEICDVLNKEVFGVDSKQAAEIVLTTMAIPNLPFVY